jgi:hypothetical protein
VISVSETAHLSLDSHRGTQLLNEQGTGSGTFSCPVSVQMEIARSPASMVFTCRAHGGTLSGRGQASFYVAGSTVYFSGSLSSIHGTGRYSHAAARGVHVKGTMRRSNYAFSVTLSGKMSL